jgi:SAM-dependent methyltransferase
MHGYYDQRLAADALERCYDLAPPRVQQYLRAEVDFVVERLAPTDVVLDLGCGYGRTIPDFARASSRVVGIDRSHASLRKARDRLRAVSNSLLACMDAVRLGFTAESFDQVVCIQNGISAFHIDPGGLVREALRVLRVEGTAIFSTYSDRFWEHRLDWFERQAAAGLLGEIDRERTREGLIVCTDGFTSGTVRPDEFRVLVPPRGVDFESVEVDGSSMFYVGTKRSGS